MNNFCIITTINKPTKSVEAWYEKFGEKLIVVGDKKTPSNWHYKLAQYINPDLEPFNHYARKNLGYLLAMKQGAEIIYDTDDDNEPNANWGLRFKETKACKSFGEGWFNAYEPMCVNKIWPRGFPISQIRKGKELFGSKEAVTSSIQQGLADGDPDVDAIHRMVFDKKYEFKFDRSIYLQKNTWCPFNSQATWWFPDAYPLMYLPVHCSMRMTDIWRGFIAQKCLWEINQGVTFHSPAEVFQDRNEHDLRDDFMQEIDGHKYNEKIVEILTNLVLNKGKEQMCRNLYVCYVALVSNGIFPKQELESVEQWIKDYEDVAKYLG